MKKIVITGGPCAGKTTVINALKAEFGATASFVPECATLILSGGFPAPPDQQFLGHEKFDNWQRQFQNAIYHTQLALEDLAVSEAQLENKDMVICDRAIADGIAYHPEGLAGFIFQFHIHCPQIYDRYDAVIFLESLAIGQPELFSRAGNEHRYESVENASEVNGRTRRAWYLHKNFHYIESSLSLEEKIAHVRSLVLGEIRG